jgi:hypothetical protein
MLDIISSCWKELEVGRWKWVEIERKRERILRQNRENGSKSFRRSPQVESWNQNNTKLWRVNKDQWRLKVRR